MLRPNQLRLLIPGLLLITLIACGSDDPAPAVVPPVTLAEGVTVEPGSDEAEIVSLTERALSNLRRRDAVAIHADCHPDLQAKVSVDELAAVIEEYVNLPYHPQPIYTSEHNWVITRFRAFGDSATFTYDWREGEEVVDPAMTQTVEKVSDRWYMTSRNGRCGGVGGRGPIQQGRSGGHPEAHRRDRGRAT